MGVQKYYTILITLLGKHSNTGHCIRRTFLHDPIFFLIKRQLDQLFPRVTNNVSPLIRTSSPFLWSSPVGAAPRETFCWFAPTETERCQSTTEESALFILETASVCVAFKTRDVWKRGKWTAARDFRAIRRKTLLCGCSAFADGPNRATRWRLVA